MRARAEEDREWESGQRDMEELSRLRSQVARFRENHRASTVRANARRLQKMEARIEHLESKYGLRGSEPLRPYARPEGGLSPPERRACRLLDVTEEAFLAVKSWLPLTGFMMAAMGEQA